MTPVTPANINAMTMPVSQARAPIRASAASKANSIAPRVLLLLAPLLHPIGLHEIDRIDRLGSFRRCIRDPILRVRRQLPHAPTHGEDGQDQPGAGARMNRMPVSFHEVMNIRINAPIDVTIERTAIEKLDPKKVSISVTSAVERETASPVFSFEK